MAGVNERRDRKAAAKGERVGGQRKEELDNLCTFLASFNVASILEIGSREGAALVYMARNIPSVCAVYSIDLPGGPWGTAGSDTSLLQRLRQLRDSGYSAENLFADSTSDEAVKWAEDREPFDFIFIDGDHSYDGVVSDYANYSQMGRIIGFHDINHPPDSRAYGPTKLWNELKGVVSDDYGEIIAKNSKSGIGLLF